MNQMKRITAFLLMIVFAFAGCGNSVANTEEFSSDDISRSQGNQIDQDDTNALVIYFSRTGEQYSNIMSV